MKKNAVVGLALIVTAGVLAVVMASSRYAALQQLVGIAAWYLPYAALVVGVSRMVRER